MAVGSSTMPHKVNPAHSRTVVQLSRQVPHQAEVLLDWMVSIHERDQISNSDTIGEISVTAERLTKAAVRLVETIKVNPENMRRNLGRTNGLIMAEHAMFLLGEQDRQTQRPRGGRRSGEGGLGEWHHAGGRTRCPSERGEARRRARPGRQLDPAGYIGLAPESVDRTIAAIRKARAED